MYFSSPTSNPAFSFWLMRTASLSLWITKQIPGRPNTSSCVRKDGRCRALNRPSFTRGYEGILSIDRKKADHIHLTLEGHQNAETKHTVNCLGFILDKGLRGTLDIKAAMKKAVTVVFTLARIMPNSHGS